MGLGDFVRAGVELGGMFVDAQTVGSAISSTIDSSVKGIQTLRQKAVTIKCIGCHAPLSGMSGTTSRCPYCDTEQTF